MQYDGIVVASGNAPQSLGAVDAAAIDGTEAFTFGVLLFTTGLRQVAATVAAPPHNSSSAESQPPGKTRMGGCAFGNLKYAT